MTIIPPGAQLAPNDLPPPPPSADPREPSPTAIRGRSSRTPQRAKSPGPQHHTSSHSRGTSPSRPNVHHQQSSETSLPIIQPIPKHASSSPINPPHHYSTLSAHAPNPAHSAPHLSRPSSPASIHSSSSAIFERDIELPAVASLSINPATSAPHTLTHKASRLSQFSHGSALDHTVPAVLDDAVEALQEVQGSSMGIQALEIEAPAATSGGIGMARQSSIQGPHGAGRKTSTQSGPGFVNLGSRSPSPVSAASRASSGLVSPARSPPILSQLSTQHNQHSLNVDNTSPISLGSGAIGAGQRPPMPQRVSTGPQVPGGWTFGHGTVAEKPTEADIAESSDVVDEISPVSIPHGHSPSPPPAIPSHLTPTKDKRRISFISYNDLLLSVPTTVTPLGEITSGALSPDHLPGTISPGVPTRSPIVPTSSGVGGTNSSATQELDHKSSWDAGNSGRAGGLGLGEGEWEREGLGRGLEQRLEELVREDGPIPTLGAPILK